MDRSECDDEYAALLRDTVLAEFSVVARSTYHFVDIDAVALTPQLQLRLRDGGRVGGGNLDHERCSTEIGVIDRDRSTMRSNDVGHDRETETGAAGIASTCFVQPDESFKHMRPHVDRNAGSVVTDR